MRSRSTEPSKFLPTPIAHDAVDGKTLEQVEAMRARTGAGVSNLNEVVVHELFPTPTANLGTNGGPQHPEKRRAGGHSVSIEDAVHGLLPTPTTRDSGGSGGSNPENVTLTDAVVRTQLGTRENPRHAELFPTPIVSDANGVGVDEIEVRESPQLRAVAPSLLPTPTVGNGTGGNAQRGGDRAGEKLLPGIVVDAIEWGKYRAAVERAEAVTGIPAPTPAIPDGKGGKMRLHDRFVEWMMLLEPGWVTGHGLTRQKALERLGNGVVPLQAAAATATNLTRLAEYKRAVESLGVAA